MRKVNGFIHRHLVSCLSALFLVLAAGLAYAVHEHGVFELVEGDVCPADPDLATAECASSNPTINDNNNAKPGYDPKYSGDDWEQIWDESGSNAVRDVFVEDHDEDPGDCPGDAVYYSTEGFPNIFQGPTNKDFNDIFEWGWTENTPKSKNDLQHAMAALYRHDIGTPTGAPPSSYDAYSLDAILENILYFGADRTSVLGSAYSGFWITKDKVGIKCDGSFVGQHQAGDVLVITNYDGGGKVGTINIYKWRIPGCPTPGTSCDTGLEDTAGGAFTGQDVQPNMDLIAIQTDCDFVGSGGPGCASASVKTNGDRNAPLAPEMAPWDYVPKTTGNNPYQPGEYPPLAWVEGGINLNHPLIALSGCFQGFVAESRASFSLSADRDDFVIGAFETCGFSIIKKGANIAKAGDKTTYTFEIENTGIAELYFVSVDDDIVGSLTNKAKTECGDSLPPDDELTDDHKCSFDVEYDLPADPNDPTINTVVVVMDDQEDLQGLRISNTDNHSLPIIKPAVSLTKTAVGLAKVGDEITYSFTATNTGTGELENCSLTDDVLTGDPFPITLGVKLDKKHTLPATAGDVTNNAKVVCDVKGLTNKVEATAKHTVKVIKPAVSLSKTAVGLAKTGDKITYSFTATNTGTGELENCSLTDDVLTGDPFPITLGVKLDKEHTLPTTAGDVTNNAKVVCDVKGLTNKVEATAKHTVKVIKPAVSLLKVGPDLAKTGDEVTYSFTATNTGTGDLENCSLTDDVLTGDPFPITLGVKLDKKHTLPGTEGDVTNNAKVVCDVKGLTNKVEATAKHTVKVIKPAVSLSKTAVGLAKAGDEITYSFTATNTGTGELENCSLTDDVLTGDPFPITLDVKLDKKHTLPATAGDVTNNAKVVCDVKGLTNKVEATAKHTVKVIKPAVSLSKTAVGLAKTGDKITYSFTATNTGTGELENCSLTDDVLTGDPFPITLGVKLDKEHTLPTTAGDVTNNAKVTCDVKGLTNKVEATAKHTVKVIKPAVSLSKTAVGLAKTGDKITYSFTATNTGTGELENCSLTDDVLTGDPFPITLDVKLDKEHTLPTTAGDVTNNAKVTCDVKGLTNKVEATAKHTVKVIKPAVSLSKTAVGLAKTGDKITYSFTATNTGTGELENCSLTDDVLTGDPFPITLDVKLDKEHTLPTTAGDVTNNAKVVCDVKGLTNKVEATAKHTVKVIKPAVSLVKTGPDYAKGGDAVVYSFTATNNGIGDLENCTLSDTVLGSLGSITLGVKKDVNHTVPSSQTADIPNTGTVTCHVKGLTNTVKAESKHTVDIINPDFAVTKSCVNEPINVGTAANFRIRIENTGDVPVVLAISDPVLFINQTDVDLGLAPGGGCQEIDWGVHDGCLEIEDGVVVNVPGEFENNVDVTYTLDQATYPLPNQVKKSAGDFCTVEAGKATRTLGFWKSHGSDGEIFDPTVEYGYTCHVARDHGLLPIDIGWASLDTCADVFGAFWAKPSHNSDRSKRDKSCAIKINPSWQLLAMILNSGLSNGAAIPIDIKTGKDLITALQEALAGSNRKEIKRLANLADEYNNSGDNVAVEDTDGTIFPHADPNGTREWMDTSAVDCPP